MVAEELSVIPWRQSYRQRCWNNALDPMAGIQKNADIAFSIYVLREMNQIIYAPFLINSFLRIFRVWGDCSFVVEEAEA